MKSDQTIAEFETMAMLLGMEYDAVDHTLNKWAEPDSGEFGPTLMLDADTLEPLTFGGTVNERTQQVMNGQLGASDGPSQREDKVPLHGEDDT